MPFCPGSCPCAVSTFIPASGSFFSPATEAALAASISAAVCNVTIAISLSLLLIRHGSNATQETHRYRCFLHYKFLVGRCSNRRSLGNIVLLLPVADRRPNRIF